ncbi:HepT-like ribonuclease domain-containing protein [Helicobacter sp. 23-1044]
MSRAIKCLNEGIKRIDIIQSICDNNGGVVSALQDEATAQPAIMMHITIIYQQFEKLKKQNRMDILNRVPKNMISQIKKSRNITAHDYDSVNYAMIEKTIRTDLPKLKSIFCDILHEIEAQTPQERLSAEIADYESKKNILYAESKLKKEKTILKLYDELKGAGIEIDSKDLQVIKSLQKGRNTNAKKS